MIDLSSLIAIQYNQIPYRCFRPERYRFRGRRLQQQINRDTTPRTKSTGETKNNTEINKKRKNSVYYCILLSVYFLFFVFSPSHLLPVHFQHAGDLADPGSQTMLLSPTTRPVHSFHFYRALGLALPSLVDFDRSLFTHAVRFQRGRYRSSFWIEKSHAHFILGEQNAIF